MKKQLLAIMNDRGQYLAEFKTRKGNVLSFEVRFTEEFQHALLVDWDYINDDKDNMEGLEKWAETADGKLVIIDIDYQVKELETGELREEQTNDYYDDMPNFLKDIFDL